jgi:fructose-1,6-bisphosphatase
MGEMVMPCDTRATKRGQTLSQRVAEVRGVVELAARKLASGQVRVKVGPQGGVLFTGLTEMERDGVSDNCLLRRLMAGSSVTAKLAIERAELLAGRKVDKQVIGQGGHYHGDVWHSHKG